MSISYENRHPLMDVSINPETSVWLQKAIRMEDFLLGKLHYTFLTDKDLHQINLDYLNHDTYTDIITFDYNNPPYVIGEIYISLDRVVENSKKNQIDFLNELHRILVHGLLHLVGYKDKSLKEKTIMTAKEDYYLSLLPQK